MASCHFLCLALISALSFLILDMAFGARSLATTANPNDEAKFFGKHIPLPKLKINPHKEPIKVPKFRIPPKKPITLPKVIAHPSHPKTQNGFEQSLVPSFPRNFRLPQNFDIPGNFDFPPLAPYLSSPSLPFPDLPLVPGIPFTPPYVPVSDQTSAAASKKAKDQSP